MLEALVLLAEAAIDTSFPHRVAVERMPLSVEVIQTNACVARGLGRQGKVTSYPMADGYGYDWTYPTFLIAQPNTAATFEVHNGGYLRVLYRHPMSQEVAVGLLRSVAKLCFREDFNAWAASNGAKIIKEPKR